MAWPLEAIFFLAAAAAQGLLAALLLARHNRREWAWALAVLLAFNGAVALVRGLLMDFAHAPLCTSCSWMAAALWLWLEPATLPLLAYFFLTYPARPRWGDRHPWLLRALVFGPTLAWWGLIVLARTFVLHREAVPDWRESVHFLLGTGVLMVFWCIILLRGAWLLGRVASPLRHRQLSFLYAIVGMRAAHLGLLQLMAELEQLPSWLGQEARLAFNLAFLVAPAMALGASVVLLAKARVTLPSSQARGVTLALAFLATGAFLAFLPGPRGIGAGFGWSRLLTHYDLYVLRPAVVWLAVIQPLYADRLGDGRLGAFLAVAYAAAGAFAATLPAFSGLVQGIAFLATLAILAALASGLLVALLARWVNPAERTASRAARQRAVRTGRYALALEAVWRRGQGTDLPLRKRLHRLRRRLGIGAAEHDSLLRAHEADWKGPPAESEWQPGDVLLSRYEVVGLLGQGGWGETHRCRDVLTGEQVVLKRTLRCDPAARRALATEAAALSQLRSRRIVRCRAIERRGSETILVLDYLPGGSLLDRLGQGRRLPLRSVRALGLDVLAALQAAHAAGIVHGDLKPSNILFDASGRAVLADFGAARRVPPPLDLAGATQEPFPLGSLRYMAPEQVQGLPADARTDLYALAVVLCEAATGLHPLHALTSDLEMRQAIAQGRVGVPAGVPHPLGALLQGALSREPPLRPPSAAAMAAGLRGRTGARQARSSRRLRPTPTTSPA